MTSKLFSGLQIMWESTHPCSALLGWIVYQKGDDEVQCRRGGMEVKASAMYEEVERA